MGGLKPSRTTGDNSVAKIGRCYPDYSPQAGIEGEQQFQPILMIALVNRSQVWDLGGRGVEETLRPGSTPGGVVLKIVSGGGWY